jgi:hypothetical protein
MKQPPELHPMKPKKVELPPKVEKPKLKTPQKTDERAGKTKRSSMKQ